MRNRQGFLLWLDRLQLYLAVDLLRTKIEPDDKLFALSFWRVSARSGRGDLPQFPDRLLDLLQRL